MSYFVILILLSCIAGGCTENCTRAKKKMDQAWITIKSNPPLSKNVNLSLYAQSAACYKCELIHMLTIPSSYPCTIQVQTMFENILEVREETHENKVLWRKKANVNQHSEYMLLISSRGNNYSFNFSVHKEGNDANIPIYVAMCIYVVLGVLWSVLSYTGFIRKTMDTVRGCTTVSESQTGLIQDIDQHSQTEPTVGAESIPTRRRIRSLDAFRGICLCIMIFVNYGGGGYWFFDHSYWNGLTVADLVFPWFTWIIGTAIAISFKNIYQKGNTTKLKLSLKVIKRTTILFFLGLALESSNGGDPVDMYHLRIPGVLQRLAVSYGVVALLQVHFAQDYVEDRHREKWFSSVRDVIPFWPEWLVMFTFVVIHLLLTFLVSEKGCPKGYLGPGGIAEGGKYPHCTGGAAGYVDRYLFGENHIYQTPTFEDVYNTTLPYDPEGALGTLTSIFMCFLGLQAGKILLLSDDWIKRVVRWLSWALITGILGGCLCRFSQNEGWIPVNKNLWSLSFVLVLACMAFILLAACYVSIDVFGVWTGAPFIFTGMNSILVYVCHLVFSNYFPVSWQVPKSHSSLLALHLWGPILWSIVAAVLYYKKIFVAI